MKGHKKFMNALFMWFILYIIIAGILIGLTKTIDYEILKTIILQTY